MNGDWGDLELPQLYDAASLLSLGAGVEQRPDNAGIRMMSPLTRFKHEAM